MPELGPLEIIMVAAIALIVFGPEKLPVIARSIGKAMNEVRRMASEVKAEFETGMDVEVEDEPEEIADETKPIPTESDEADETK